MYPLEQMSYEDMNFMYNVIANDIKKDAKNKYLFPTLMSDIMASKFPPGVVLTTEFDLFRRHAEELASILETKGNLLDFCCHPGVTHGWYFDFNHPTSHLFWDDMKKILEKWLLTRKE